jgi:phosphate transport system substrate-binding protein
MIPRRMYLISGSGRALALICGASLLAVVASAALTVTETGSTLIFPLFKSWAEAYTKINLDTQVIARATDSGTGMAQAIAKQVQIGTSDAYMSDTQAMANRNIINIPLVISAQTVDANLPELRGNTLKLSGPVLAGIYSGTIREWDAPPVAAINGGVRLPHKSIIPVHRAEGSGDTFIFTQYLTFSTPEWEKKIRNVAGATVPVGANIPIAVSGGTTYGYGTYMHWPPVPGSLTAASNQEMVDVLGRTPYSVGYLGASFKAAADQAGLETAMLQNQDGKFVLPTATAISAAAAALTPRTPADERLTLVFAPGPDSYPLISYEYAIVSTQQPNQQVAAAISSFLLWCISPQGGSTASFLEPLHFIALPTAIRALSEIQIAKIQHSGG